MASNKKFKQSLWKNISAAVLVFVAVLILFSFIEGDSLQKKTKISLSDLVGEINEGRVESIVIEDSGLDILLKDGEKQESYKESSVSLIETLDSYKVDKEKLQNVKLEIKDTTGLNFWVGTILPFLVPLVIIVGFIWFMMRSVQGSSSKAFSFGQSQARKIEANGRKRVTFKDVAGCKEAKEELFEVVEFLKEPTKFLRLGAKIPKGVLLMGAPGTGKTLLARAVAGQANVPFFHISGSEFVEMFVGVGASRVRDLFKKAKKEAPAIVFIDEIDAVGRQRGTGLGGSHDEREQTLNQILVEMDGFDTNTNVIVIAATNRPDVLDSALLRPGRFDRRVVIENPDIKDRIEILKVHSRGKPLASDVDLEVLAQRTPGFSGADLENLLNEAAILSARRARKTVGMAEATEAIEKVVLGPERKSRVISPEDKKLTAYHEAGHAVVAHVLVHADPVQKVSIVSRGMAGGYTMHLPEKEKRYKTKNEFIDNLSVYLAGYAVEKKFLGDISTGASSDLQEATDLARKLVVKFGMSDKIGPVAYGTGDEYVFLGKEIAERKDYSEATQRDIDQEIKNFIDTAYKRTKEVVVEQEERIRKVADALMERETLEKAEFLKIVK